MSLPRSLKLQLESEIHKLTDIPLSLAALRSLLLALFGSSDLVIKYQKEPGDWVTIDSDADLISAYDSAKDKSSLKFTLNQVERFAKFDFDEVKKEEDSEGSGLFSSLTQRLKSVFRKGKATVQKVSYRRQFYHQLVLTEVSSRLGLPMPREHPGVTCANCKQSPVFGIRYKCLKCNNFDLCDVCEATCEHEHGLLKLVNPVDKKDEGVKKIWTLLMGVKRPEMTAIERKCTDTVPRTPNEQALISWILRNSGKEQWPKNTRISHIRGPIFGPTSEVQALLPGEEATVEIFVTAPREFGVHKGCFALVDKEGTRFGEELEVEMQVVPDPAALDELASTLESMGFSDRSQILAALTHSGGDLTRAIDLLSS